MLETALMNQLMKMALASGVTAFGLVACGTSDGPVGFGGADPLRAPGSSTTSPLVEPGFRAGEFVRAIVDNTAFFTKRPKGESDADKVLPRGTSMKVVSTVDSYLKVELDSGEIGFVPSVMVEGSAENAAPLPPTNPNEIQLYPPLPGSDQPLPQLAPGEQPPAGSIPTVIDPDAPATEPTPTIAPPDQTPPNVTVPTSPEAATTSASSATTNPAPVANSKELEEMKKRAAELAPKEGETPPAQ